MRTVGLLILLLVSSPVLAKSKAESNSAVQFIDKSVIYYPQTLGDHSLIEPRYDPAKWAEGLSLNYRISGAAPGLVFSLYVYPLGRSDEAKAVLDAMADVEAGIRYYEQQQTYAAVKFGSSVDFPVRAPRFTVVDGRNPVSISLDSTAPVDVPASDAQTDGDELPEVVRALMPPTITTGRRLAISFVSHDKARRSLAYVFYRNLFLFKVRATVPADEMGEDVFNAAIDRAVQALVPAIEVHNFGTCGTIHVSVDKDTGNKEQDAENGALELAAGMGRIQRESCASSDAPDSKAGANTGQETIVFPPDTWN